MKAIQVVEGTVPESIIAFLKVRIMKALSVLLWSLGADAIKQLIYRWNSGAI